MTKLLSVYEGVADLDYIITLWVATMQRDLKTSARVKRILQAMFYRTLGSHVQEWHDARWYATSLNWRLGPCLS